MKSRIAAFCVVALMLNLRAEEDLGPEPWDLWEIQNISAKLSFDESRQLTSFARIEGIGWHLAITRHLKDDDYGWGGVLLDIPERWMNSRVDKIGETICITVSQNEVYFVGRWNVRVFYEKMWEKRETVRHLTDEELLKLWREYGKEDRPNQALQTTRTARSEI